MSKKTHKLGQQQKTVDDSNENAGQQLTTTTSNQQQQQQQQPQQPNTRDRKRARLANQQRQVSVSGEEQVKQEASSDEQSGEPEGQPATPNICAACAKPIKERYLLRAIDKQWHEDCLKCACCDCRLGEVGSSLFTHADKIFCRRDFLRIFGQHGHCAVCKRSIPPYELVMRANENAYHMDCFACQQCQYRFCVGDRFHLTETHKIICLMCHNEQQQQQQQPTLIHHQQADEANTQEFSIDEQQQQQQLLVTSSGDQMEMSLNSTLDSTTLDINSDRNSPMVQQQSPIQQHLNQHHHHQQSQQQHLNHQSGQRKQEQLCAS